MTPGDHPGKRPDAETFARYLRRLDDEAFTAFVAALWDARGWAVTREDGLLRVSDGATVRLLAPVAGGRFRGTPSVPDDGRVDAVVTAALEPDDAASLAADRGADLLDARDVHRMLRYALDPDVAASLCATHLGARPEEMRPPLRRRASDARDHLPAAGTVLSAALAILAVGGVVWLLTAGGSLTGERPTPPTIEPGPGTGTTVETPDDPATAELEGVEDVPGLSSSGVADVAALARSHEQVLTNRSYTRSSTYRGPGPRNRTRGFVVRNTEVRTDGTRWRQRVTTIWNRDEGEDERQRRVVETFFDGEAGYVARYDGEGFTYERTDERPAEIALLDPTAVSGQTVRRYLSVDDTSVTGTVTDDGDRYYRVVGSGDPSAAGLDGVADYSVVALVHESGYVGGLQASYVVETPNGTREATASIAYDAVGATPVDPPEWYERRWGGDPGTEGTTVREGNATESDPGTESGTETVTLEDGGTCYGGGCTTETSTVP